jgi:hypothetical protein
MISHTPGMGQDGHRPRQGPVPRSVYWQRRAVAFMLGVCLLGLLVVTVNGMLGTGAGATKAAGSGGTHPPGGSPAQRGRTARPARSVRSARTARPRPSSPSPALPGRGERPACAARNLVLSLSTSRYWYRSGQRPQFAVDVVSVARQSCSFNLGARFVSIVISQDPERIWGSSDCTLGAGSRVVTLTRGVPAVFRVSWDRKTSAAGCMGTRRPARLGTYTATAFSDHLHSKTLIIVLAGPGVGGP